MFEYNEKKAKHKLQKELDEDRYEHTIGVMHTAACLAMRYNADIEKAKTAGLLHDCAKCIPNKKKIELCEKYHVALTDFELKAPFLIHAKLGAAIAKEKYHIQDQEILNAISSHTTGRPNMSLLDKIVFIADYIEPGRSKAPNLKEIRALAFQDIDEALIKILKDTLAYLESENEPIDPTTEEVLAFYTTERTN